MKWADKEPKCWDTRRRQAFLLWPQTIGDECRWLEVAEWEEQYAPSIIGALYWYKTRWIAPDDSADAEPELQVSKE